MTNEQYDYFSIAKNITRAAFNRYMPPRLVDRPCRDCDNTRRVETDYGDRECHCVGEE